MNGTTRDEVLDEVSNWLVGGGIVTMALAPLALPGMALLLVAAIPLLALGLAGGSSPRSADRADPALTRPRDAGQRAEGPGARPGRGPAASTQLAADRPPFSAAASFAG